MRLRNTLAYFRNFFVISAVFILAGCLSTGAGQSNHRNVSDVVPELTMPDVPEFKNVDPGTPEELLAAEGNWNLVEEGEVYDPTQAHLAARQKVNPRQMRKRDDLIAHFEPDIENGKNGKFRVLKMKPQGTGWQDDLGIEPGFQVTETSFTKPTQKVAAAGEFIPRTNIADTNVNYQPTTDTDTIPIPGRKPDRSMNVASIPVQAVPLEPEFTLRKATKNPAPPTSKFEPVAKHTPAHTGFLGTLKKSLIGQEVQQASRVDNSKNNNRDNQINGQRNVRYQIITSGQPAATRADLKGFRSALHEGKTRIAMDMSTSVRYKVAIDHIRNVLRVKLEHTRWLEPMTGTMRASGLLGTYVAKAQPDGSVILEIRLKNKAKIADTTILRPDQTAHHRIVIDLEV